MSATKAKELGSLIARSRAKKGLTTRRLAAQLGVSNSWITKLEAGLFLDPSPEKLARLAEALDIDRPSIDQLMPGAMAGSLPELGTYFRAKYDLTPEAIEKVERYIERLRRAA